MEIHPTYTKLQESRCPVLAVSELMDGAVKIAKGAGIDVTYTVTRSDCELNHDLWQEGMRQLHIAMAHLGARTRARICDTINKLKALPHVSHHEESVPTNDSPTS